MRLFLHEYFPFSMSSLQLAIDTNAQAKQFIYLNLNFNEKKKEILCENGMENYVCVRACAPVVMLNIWLLFLFYSFSK